MKHILLAMATGICLSVPALAEHANKNYPAHTFFQSATITGKVTNENGEPLANVTIQVKGRTDISAVSAIDGTFSIAVPTGTTKLIFSYVGAEPQEVDIAGKTTIAVQLKSQNSTLDDVVVIGYGTQKKINLTGAVASVSGNTLTQRPAPNASNLLQGRIPGLQVTQPSGEPGRDNATLLIRGRATFGGGTAPLVLIDGVTGNLNNISPNDIETITVLKDAASAAIYGSRSANGVVLVITRKGRKGQLSVNYQFNIGRHIPTALPDFVTNSAEYMEMYNAAATRSGVAFKYAQAEIDKYKNPNANRNQYPNFDNVDYYFNPGTVMNHNLSVSGGTDKSTYNVSLSYLDQDAMLPGYNFKRYNLLLNYSNQVSKHITIGTIMNMTYKNRQEPPFTSENMALLVYASGPLYGPFLPDGSGRVVTKGYINEGRNRNAQEALTMGWQNTKEYNLNAQAYMDVKLLKGLTWSSKVAVNYVDEYYKMYQHPYQSYYLQERDAVTNDYLAFTLGPDLLGVTDQYSKTITPTIYSTFAYETKFGEHNIRALVGYEQLFFKFQTLRGRRINTVNTALTELAGYTNTGEALLNTYPRLPGLSGPSEWAMQSFFGRVGYDYKGKYLLEANLRYDGTSKVSPDFRWGWFPSVSAGWLVSNENFLRDNLSWINNLKLRASYGTLGNQDVGTYLYQDVLTISGISYPFGNAAPVQGAVINTYRDKSLRWEETQNLDFGLDVDVLNGLLGVTFDWFRKTSSNLLASQLIPASLGFTSPTLNIGKMRSQGIELELRHRNKIGQFHYDTYFQISTAKNKVLDIRVPSAGTSVRRIGDPFDEHYLYIWDGIFQAEDLTDPKVPKHALNPTPKAGDLKMKDVTGDGLVDANDRQVVKGVYPDYIYSFGLNADFKGFGLSAFFQGVQGIRSRVNNWGIDPFMQGTPPTTKWRDAWTPQNRSNTLPAIYTAGYAGVANYSGSTYYLMDASYLRLKNIMLSYTVPASVYSKIKAKGLTVYVSADNLVTFTSYEGSDPERGSATGNYVQYPQAKIINAGVNVRL
jgi:TonB-linked SusC/RagA family outer membrane protein